MSSEVQSESATPLPIGCWIAIALLVSLPVFFCIGFMLPFGGIHAPLEFVIYVAFGWATFLFGVVPQIQLNLAGIGTGIASLLIFTFGLHRLLKWFYAAVDFNDPAHDAGAPARQWPVRWTGSIVALICVMFVAGICMVGFTHQLIWLATSPERLTVDRARLHEEVLKLQADQKKEKAEKKPQDPEQ